MSRRRVVAVGNRRDYPRELWGPRDFEAEREEMERIGAPLPHSPPSQVGELRFSIFETPITGGTRSRAIDELIEKHVGRRR